MAFHHALPRLRARATAKHRDFTNVLLFLKTNSKTNYLENLCIDFLGTAKKIVTPVWFCSPFEFFFSLFSQFSCLIFFVV